MTVPYHTHEFEIPIAERSDIENKTGAADKAVVPALLGTAALADKEEFASKAQGEKAENAAPASLIIRAGKGLAGGGALTQNISLELDGEVLAQLTAARQEAQVSAAAASKAGQKAAEAGKQADEALKAANAAGDVYKKDLGALAFKTRIALADIGASGALSADNVLCGDGVWRKPAAGGGSGGGAGSGSGGGDMRREIYDPGKKQADVYDMDNMAEGRANKIFSAAERAKLAALPDQAAPSATQIQAGAGLSGGGALTGAVMLRLSDASLAALEQAKTAPSKTELGSLAYKSKIAAGEIDAGGTPGNKSFLRGDGQWAEPQSAAPALSLPAGMIAPFASQLVPEGWLICNGRAVLREQYPALFAAVGTIYGGTGSASFNLPDLRGEFIRGFDSGRGIDKGRIFGTVQTDALQNIKGAFSTQAGIMPNTDVFTEASGVFALAGEKHCRQRPMGRLADISGASPDLDFDLSRAARTASETRPRNIALLYCIKI